VGVYQFPVQNKMDRVLVFPTHVGVYLYKVAPRVGAWIVFPTHVGVYLKVKVK